jgi:beta-galactosidase
LSIKGESWLAAEPEVRLWRGQTFAEPKEGVLMRVVGSKAPNALEVRVGKGHAIVLAANYPAHFGVFRSILERLGAKSAFRHDYRHDGIIVTSQRTPSGERLLTVINLDSEDKAVDLTERGVSVFDQSRLNIGGRKAKLLPIGVKIGPLTIHWSTAEIVDRDLHSISFKPSGFPEHISIESRMKLAVTGAEVDQGGNLYRIRFESKTQAAKISWSGLVS